MVYLAWDADGAGRKVGQAVLSDDVTELRRVSQAIEQGNEIVKSWLLASSGTITEAGGDEGSGVIPAEHLKDLPDIRRRYEAAVGCTLSVGVGMRLSEAAKALYAAKLTGKDQIKLYGPDCEEILSQEKPPKDGAAL